MTEEKTIQSQTESTDAGAPTPATELSAAAPAWKYRSVLRRLRFLPFAIIFASVALFVWLDSEATPVNVTKFVNAVEVTRPPSFGIDAGALIGQGSERDFYVLIRTKGGVETELEIFKNTLIGNGLTWNFKSPVALSAIAELELLDSDIVSDDKLDRVTVGGNLITTGQKYRFELKEENPSAPPADLRVVWSIISGCGVLALVTGVFFIRDQAAD